MHKHSIFFCIQLDHSFSTLCVQKKNEWVPGRNDALWIHLCCSSELEILSGWPLLAEMFGRSKKSIIGKLSREGVYRREVYVSKTGESPITKVEIVSNIAEGLGVETKALAGLEKSPKAALRNLEKAVAGLTQIFEHKDYPGGV